MPMTGLSRYSCFNPRAREGRDFLKRMSPPVKLSFNPRAREGRDIAR